MIHLPICIASSAYSFAQWLWRSATGTHADTPDGRQDAARMRHLFGLTSPAMSIHWKRLRLAQPDPLEIPTDEYMFMSPEEVLEEWKAEPYYHRAKNVLSEWTRLDPQRAAKLNAFLFVLLLFTNTTTLTLLLL